MSDVLKLEGNCERKCITHQVVTSPTPESDGIMFSCGLKTCEKVKFGTKDFSTDYFLSPDGKSALYSVRINPDEAPKTINLEVCFTDDIDNGKVGESFSVVDTGAVLNSDSDSNKNSYWKFLYTRWLNID